MGKRVVVILFLATVITIYPMAAFAKDKTDVNVSGEFNSGDVHYSAADKEYILKGKVHIENNTKKKLKDLQLVLDVPDGVNFAYEEEKPMKLDNIPAGGSLDHDISVHMTKSDIASDHVLSTYLAVADGEGELEKIAELEGEADLSVMKGDYTEVDAQVDGQVEQDDEDKYVLDITVEGTNQSIYDIKTEDEVYVAFELPYDVEVDAETAPKGTTQTIGGGHGMQAIAQIDAKAGDSIKKEYSIPLKGELSSSQLNDLNDRVLLIKRYPGKTLEYTDAGAVHGNTDLDFTAMDESKQEEASKKEAAEDTEKEEKEDKQEVAASGTVDHTDAGSYKFFDVPFFVGILGGLVISMLFFIILRGRRKA